MEEVHARVMTRSPVWIALALGALASAFGCVKRLSCDVKDVRAGFVSSCPVAGWTDRAFDLEIPSSWDGKSPLPVIFTFHGGGGNRASIAEMTCPSKDESDPGCLSVMARSAGFAVVRGDGTGSRPLRNLRTWNAGGGRDGYACANGPACKADVDDVRYFDDLFAEVAALIPVDETRVHVTGFSNGAAMTHRIACERPDRVASFVAVGGENQHAAVGGACPGMVSMMQVHGTDDPCWGYTQDGRACLDADRDGVKVGAQESIDGWRARNGCHGEGTSIELPDQDPADGTRVTRVVYDCARAVELVRVDGGGHTWPGGHPGQDAIDVGRITRDIGNDVVVEFFRAHPKH